MAAEVGRAYYGWPREELSGQDESQGASISRMLDHGSVSFGRYAVDPLSWEKRSVFTSNSRQEELEKCCARGLVSQKKAYFEEFYKNLRAAKASKDNKQPEVAFDSRSKSSNSKQSCEEDETAVELDLQTSSDEVAKVGNSFPDETASGVVSQRVTICGNNVQVADLDLQTSSSPSKDPEEIEEPSSNYAFQIQNLDTELTSDEVLLLTQETIHHHGKSSLDPTADSEKYTKVSLTNESNKAAQDGRSSVHEMSKKNTNLSSVHEVDKAAQGALIPSTKFELPNTNISLNSLTRNKIAEVSKLHKKGCVSFTVIKDPSVRNVSKMGYKSKYLSNLSHNSDPDPKRIGKPDSSLNSSRTTTDKQSSNNMSTLIASSRSFREGRSKPTVPCPFSFASERQTAGTSGLSDSRLRLVSKSSNRLASSRNHAKDLMLVQGTSKKQTTANGAEGRATERFHRFSQPKESNLHGENDKKHHDFTIRSKAKENLQSQKNSLSLNNRNPKINNLPLDVRKPRQAKPRWR